MTGTTTKRALQLSINQLTFWLESGLPLIPPAQRLKAEMDTKEALQRAQLALFNLGGS